MLLSIFLPWYYWNGFYYRFVIRVIDVQFSLTYYLWGVSGSFPVEAYNKDWGSNPVGEVSSNLKETFGLFMISTILGMIGTIISASKRKVHVYIETLCYGVGTLLCFVGVVNFFYLASKSGPLYGHYYYEVTWPFVMIIESWWGPSIGPYIAVLAFFTGAFACIISSRSRKSQTSFYPYSKAI